MSQQFYEKATIEEVTIGVKKFFEHEPKVGEVFEGCFLNTLNTTLKKQNDGSIFMLTGDIPAMWLRDSSAQLKPYMRFINNDDQLAELIKGVIQKQINSILIDPYANAFNENSNGKGHQEDQTKMQPSIWERKYEIDSLCYPIELSYLYWKKTGRDEIFHSSYLNAIEEILSVWETEQNHEENSSYYFERFNCPDSDTLPRSGRGAETTPTGMTWSGFRPSDDACQYGYLVPSNMFACVVLGYLEEIISKFYKDKNLLTRVTKLKNEIKEAIETYGVYEHPKYGKIYAYETDGMGNYNLMDDANVPSLLSTPYIGYCKKEDEIYKNTRRFILSDENPYYYRGKIAEGVGSPHTPKEYVWHISLAIQGLTATSIEEKESIIDLLMKTDAGKGYMHEGFDVNDPSKYTREWFSWANAMYCDFILDYIEIKKTNEVNVIE